MDEEKVVVDPMEIIEAEIDRRMNLLNSIDPNSKAYTNVSRSIIDLYSLKFKSEHEGFESWCKQEELDQARIKYMSDKELREKELELKIDEFEFSRERMNKECSLKEEEMDLKKKELNLDEKKLVIELKKLESEANSKHKSNIVTLIVSGISFLGTGLSLFMNREYIREIMDFERTGTIVTKAFNFVSKNLPFSRR